MNKIVEEILSTGFTSSPHGELIKIHSHIDQNRIDSLTHIIRDIKPVRCLEVGLAYGISALVICEALPKTSETLHIIIDPHQNLKHVWAGIGIHNLRKAGFEDLIEFYEQPSYRALPILESRNIKIDFAFIDGWHTFDYTLVDFFYIDKILNTGGLVAFDDADWPAVRRVCRFIAKNLNYNVYELPSNLVSRTDTPSDTKHSSKNILYLTIKNLKNLLPISGKEKTEDVEKTEDMKLGLRGNLIVFKKESDDSRKWNHYVSF